MMANEVLIVDDETEILETLKNHMAIEGISVDIATNVEDALKQHKDNPYRVVITDIRMPGMDGIDLIRALKKTHPTCIIYVMTGYASLLNLIECLECGATDYFIKPFQSSDIIVNAAKEGLTKQKRWMSELVQTKNKK
jgi:DNA-binding NtrC family response regulator